MSILKFSLSALLLVVTLAGCGAIEAVTGIPEADQAGVSKRSLELFPAELAAVAAVTPDVPPTDEELVAAGEAALAKAAEEYWETHAPPEPSIWRTLLSIIEVAATAYGAASLGGNVMAGKAGRIWGSIARFINAANPATGKGTDWGEAWRAALAALAIRHSSEVGELPSGGVATGAAPAPST